MRDEMPLFFLSPQLSYILPIPHFLRAMGSWAIVFDRMQYIIGFPEKIERHKYKHEIRNFEGKVIVNIMIQKYKSYGLLPLMELRFIDDHGICLGIMRQRKPGFVVLELPPLDILGPQEDTRGRIELHGDYYDKTMNKTHHGPHVLFDALDQQIASSDPFVIKSSLSDFEYLQKNGLDYKAPDGRTIATLRDSSGPPGIQIDLFPPVTDMFLVLSLVVHVLF